MTEFTIIHRGVPIGTAATPPGPDPDPADPFRFCFLDFQPSAAYETVGPVLRLASRALANFGFLGPAADPASDTAGQAAYAAARALWDEFELADTTGQRVSGRVLLFLEYVVGGQASYWLHVGVDEAGASVPARLRLQSDGAPAHGSPAA